ncbi:elongation of very long chain fatty acids protein F-like [Drosophila busckii]|uniref:elongation of very long chain fatty acids protein F-like n=1 Tax=Drosophila busckii TaxID=30019 RepID=UPI00083EA8E0|nr:elongation of very long chain fatty acids protein F-like [Drosophila busckii]
MKLMEYRADAFVKQLPLADSAWAVTLILVGYLAFVLKLGRIYMQSRAPYNVKHLMLVYNLFQIVFNASLCLYGGYYFFRFYNLSCMETLPFDNPHKQIERWGTYAYYLNKILDLLDTVFFVLRKSYKQITLLHVYHHIMMVYTVFWVQRFYGFGGQYALMGILNTCVHSVMYTYYFFSAKYPQLKQSIWWKKYITTIQIAQFLILFVQSIYMLLFNRSCTFPLFMQYMQLFQASVMLIMFTKFYIQAYVKPIKKKQQ